MNPLDALSPIDGRYSKKVSDLREHLSERALIKARIRVELEYLKFILKTLDPETDEMFLEYLVDETGIISQISAEKVKEIEKTTNHDVKAVEIAIRNEILYTTNGDTKIANLIHFGLTSEDVNNVAYKIMLCNTHRVVMKTFVEIYTKLFDITNEVGETKMLAKTHGQFAYPVSFLKEMSVYLKRFNSEEKVLGEIKFTCKFGGAVGTLIDHYSAFPEYDWDYLFDEFTKKYFGMERQISTTQIENYTDFCQFLDVFKRMANILRDLCQDMWLYISYGYLKLKVISTETGSSVMAHKINPIHFENAIGNFRLAVSLFECLSRELPVSMLQRDLTTSTMLRSLGEAFGHFVVGMESCKEGLSRITLNHDQIQKDINSNWQVFAGVYQNVLRVRCPEIEDPYSLFKDFVRDGKPKTRQQMEDFIKTLSIPEKEKDYLFNLKLV